MLIAAVVGIVGAVLTGVLGGGDYAASVGWDCAASVFLVWTWTVIATMDAAETASHATREDPSKRFTQLLVLGASVASLVGVGYLLVQASSAKGAAQAFAAGLGVFSVAASWLVVHTLCTLRYATYATYATDSPRPVCQDRPPVHRRLWWASPPQSVMPRRGAWSPPRKPERSTLGGDVLRTRIRRVL